MHDGGPLTLEAKESRARYGESRFGQGCLFARRLVEEGARFVEVTTEYIPFFATKDGHGKVAMDIFA